MQCLYIPLGVTSISVLKGYGFFCLSDIFGISFCGSFNSLAFWDCQCATYWSFSLKKKQKKKQHCMQWDLRFFCLILSLEGWPMRCGERHWAERWEISGVFGRIGILVWVPQLTSYAREEVSLPGPQCTPTPSLQNKGLGHIQGLHILASPTPTHLFRVAPWRVLWAEKEKVP